MASEKQGQLRAEIRRQLDLAWEEYDTIVIDARRSPVAKEMKAAAREQIKKMCLKWWLNED